MNKNGNPLLLTLALLVWTVTADLLVAWFGLWKPTEFDDPGAVEGDFLFALLMTSTLWLLGAVIVIFGGWLLGSRSRR